MKPTRALVHGELTRSQGKGWREPPESSWSFFLVRSADMMRTLFSTWGLKGRALAFCVLLLSSTGLVLSGSLIWLQYRGTQAEIREKVVVHAESLSQIAESAVLLNDSKPARANSSWPRSSVRKANCWHTTRSEMTSSPMWMCVPTVWQPRVVPPPARSSNGNQAS